MDKLLQKSVGEITDPFTHFNGETSEVWEWISKYHTPIYWARGYLSMLGLKV